MERIEVELPPAERVTLAGLSVRVSPEGELDRERLTVPVKLLTLLSVMVEFDVAPVVSATLVGLAAMLKSGGWVLKNSVIALAFASLLVKGARFQLVSIVLGKEYWEYKLGLTKLFLATGPAQVL